MQPDLWHMLDQHDDDRLAERGVRLWAGDCREVLADLPAHSVHAIITSPPYWGKRQYGADTREIGREPDPDTYIAQLVAVFDAAWRVLRDDGVLVINLGDSFANDGKWGGATGGKHVADLHGTTEIGRARHTTGTRPKNKLLLPYRVALAMQDRGWIVRSDAPWLKRNAMPEPVRDRLTIAHEYIFVLAKTPSYWWDADAIRTPHTATPQRRLTQRGSDRDAAMRSDRRYDYRLREEPGIEGHPLGRNYRTTDPWYASLDAQIAEARAELAALEELRERGGVVADADGEVLALDMSPSGTSIPHYAMFPPRLIEPFVLAACPPHCCPTCGAGYRRVINRTD